MADNDANAFGVMGWRLVHRKPLLLSAAGELPQVEWAVQDILLGCTVVVKVAAATNTNAVRTELQVAFWDELRRKFMELRMAALARMPAASDAGTPGGKVEA